MKSTRKKVLRVGNEAVEAKVSELFGVSVHVEDEKKKENILKTTATSVATGVMMSQVMKNKAYKIETKDAKISGVDLDGDGFTDNKEVKTEMESEAKPEDKKALHEALPQARRLAKEPEVYTDDNNFEFD